MNGTSQANESFSNYSSIKAGEPVGYETTKKTIGPLWTGKLHCKKTLEDLRTILFEKQLKTKNSIWKLIDLFEDESEAPMFFYTADKLASKLKKSSPKMGVIFESLRKEGYEVYRTQFSTKGFKTNAPVAQIEKMFK